MTLPSSGTLTTTQVSQEIWGDNRVFDLTGTEARALIGKPTGSVVFPNDFWGKSASFVIVINSPSNGNGYYGYNEGDNFAYGTTNPDNASVYPDGRVLADGASGHLRELFWTSGAPNYGALTLAVDGAMTIAQLPFSSVRINGISFTRASLSDAGFGDDFRAYTWGNKTNPFVIGNNNVEFLA